MTIDEAIAQARYVANEHSGCWRNCENMDKSCKECEYEHKQMEQWLEELKFRRNLQLQCEKEFFAGYEKGKNEGYNKGYADGSLSVTSEIRNKVIDEFTNELKDYFIIPHDVKVIEMKAEQLKAGGENE